MYTIEEITDIVKRTSKMAIDANTSTKKRIDDEILRLFGKEIEEKLPEYYEGYDDAVENYEAIKVHADKNTFPYRLFANRAPNQTEKSARWIKDNYKNVTNPVFIDFLNTVLRCTHDQNWSIKFGEESELATNTGETLQKYLYEGIEIYGSLEAFLKNVMFYLQLTDPMGVIAVKPKELSLTINENTGERVISSTEFVNPQPIYYNCKQVVGDGKGYYLIELHEKSEVEYYGGKKKKGRIYEFYDDQNIWIAKQIGKYVDNQFEISLYYNHGWGKVPVIRLRGIPRIDEDRIVWESPFLSAVDLLDLCAQNAAYKQASIAKCVFPATIMLGDICEFEENGNVCSDGKIGWWDNDTYHSKACPQCHGIGLVSRLGPLETILVKPEVRGQQESELKSSQKPLEYVSPEVTTLEYLSKEIDKQEQKARAILHLRTTSSEVKGTENITATGMALDQKGTYAFIIPIAQTAFETFEFIIDAIGWQRYRENYVKPELVYPQTFDVATERDILNGIAEMIKAGVPPVILQSEIYRYLKSVFYTDIRTSSVYQLMVNVDRLLVLSSDEIALRQAKQLAENWEVILHDSFLTFVDELEKENPEYLTLDFDVQKNLIIEKAKAKSNEIKEANTIETPTIERIIT